MTWFFDFMNDNRDTSFDAFRGIAITAVIAIHAIYLGASPEAPSFIYYRQILNFAVPTFFFMSGYWSSKKTIESLAEYKIFLLKKLSHVLIPYLFWSFLVLTCSAVRNGYIDVHKSIYLLLTGGTCMGYYFIIAIAQMYILTPILQYLNRRYGGSAVLIVLLFNIVGFVLLYLSRLLGVILHLPAALPFYSWMIYYELGLFSGERELAVPTRKKRLFRPFILYALLVSALFVSLEATTLIINFSNSLFLTSTTKFSVLLYSVCVIFGFLFCREYFERLPKLFGTMGRYSFGIYLIHIFILGWVVEMLNKLELIPSFQPLRQCILVVTTLFICVILISIVRRLLPRYVYGNIMGF